MHFKLLNPGKYLGAADLLEAEPTYKILRVVLEEIEEDTPKGAAPSKKKKGLVWLEGQPKGWLLCVTTAKALATMFGDETEKWAGRRVTLFGDMVMSFGEMVPAVRVRGSPELASTLSYVVKRRKKSDTFNLVKTGAAPANGKARPDPAKTAALAEQIRVRNAMKAALAKHDLRGQPALDFVMRITGRAAGHDANDVALIQPALAAEFAAPPLDSGPPPPGDEDAPF